MPELLPVGRLITDIRQSNQDETGMIMTKFREEPGAMG